MPQNELLNEYMNLLLNMSGTFKLLSEKSTEFTHLEQHIVEYIAQKKVAVNLKMIASYLNIPKQQLSVTVRNLEQNGYIIKKQDTVDKRAVLISLTDKAEKAHYERWKQIYNNFTSNLEKLNEEDQHDLTYGLYKTNKMLSKMLNND
ncbi:MULTISPECIES: MarR family winged helix-turn-helix transcriptional regulator [Bacillus]|uniref:MarR family winged helix-turn-helix transcriptional regulator n=1 Tax=Bacillus TaxID=1386 RepID=UPI0018F445F1|nr:winged helix DNA-binding protein [Bacillus cereus]MBJ8008097.1 winged helix DNA-binding protein [Bacillus cereus]WJE25733.1 MarR family transcriptional regulator [Bacillus cereus]